MRRRCAEVVWLQERKTAWEELFFDLVFVTAVAALGSNLVERATGMGSYSPTC